jgi:hypothetical protein
LDVRQLDALAADDADVGRAAMVAALLVGAVAVT